jgi:acyl carrier protein
MSDQSKAAIEMFLHARYQVAAETIDWAAPISQTGYIDSLAMFDLLAHLEEQLSVELPLLDILENFPPTLAALAGHVDGLKR